jgi:Tol biopolymer transport system component
VSLLEEYVAFVTCKAAEGEVPRAMPKGREQMYALRFKSRTNLLKVSLVAAAILAACLLALGVRVEPSQAAFPGQNGKIAFERWEEDGCEDGFCDYQAEIYTMNPDGSNQVNVSNDPSWSDKKPVWSPDGAKIAFVKGPKESHRENIELNIYTMNADGSGLTNLSTSRPQTWRWALPTWSPDGTKIAFYCAPDESASPDICLMNADGSNQTNLTRYMPIPDENQVDIQAADESHPAWSPDGTKIAFQRSWYDYDSEKPKWDIFVMNADGSHALRLTTLGHAGQPEWSPDGTKIAFQRSWYDSGTHKSNIFVMNADGSNQTRLTDGMGTEHRPAWSPDGTKIAFVGEGNSYSGAGDIFVMNADGSHEVRLTTLGRADQPKWSPDGTKIVFWRSWSDHDSETYDSAIYVVVADGSELTRLTNYYPGRDLSPDWQPLAAPTTRAECKKGGYKEFGFKNQGRCIAFVNRAAHNN